MVEEASKYAEEDKAVMDRIEARNGAESYLYGVRSTSQEEKVKEKLAEEDKEVAEKTVKEGLEWLDANRDASKEEIEAKKKEWEEVIRPILMKMYAATGATTNDYTAKAASGDVPPVEPKVEEVD
jgi:molecular chaperone DnaK (HSP70)